MDKKNENYTLTGILHSKEEMRSYNKKNGGTGNVINFVVETQDAYGSNFPKLVAFDTTAVKVDLANTGSEVWVAFALSCKKKKYKRDDGTEREYIRNDLKCIGFNESNKPKQQEADDNPFLQDEEDGQEDLPF